MTTEYKRQYQRTATAADWKAQNPVLAEGEIGFEVDSGRIKIGDGSTTWTALSYFQAGVSSVDGHSGAVDLTGTYAQRSNNLSDLGNVTTARANLGLGAAATQPLSAFLQPGSNLSDLASAATARNNLGVAQFVTPEQYGAAGDGVTDDTTALQNWLNYLATNNAAGYLHAKTYVVAGQLTVDAGNWSVTGAGWQSILKHTGAGICLTIGTKTSGSSRLLITLQNFRIQGTSTGGGGLKLIGVQFSRFERLEIDSYSAAGSCGLMLDTQSVGSFAAASANFFSGLYVTGCANGVKLTKDPADTGTDGCNFNQFTALAVRGFTEIGVNIDAGEFNCFFALDSSTTQNGATGLRINDDVNCFFGVRTDCSFGAGNTNVGIQITTNGRDHLILNPTGNGPTTVILRDDPDTPGVVVRQSWLGTDAWVGQINRTLTHAGSLTGVTARTWKNASAGTLAQYEVAYVDSTCNQGEVKRHDGSGKKPNPMVCVKSAAGGGLVQMADPGSVTQVQVDTVAVAVGDTLVTSSAAFGKATADNTTTDPRFIIGFARTSKAAGAAGQVEVKVR